MTRAASPKQSFEARRRAVVKLWNQGQTLNQIAAALGHEPELIWSDVRWAQRQGLAERRFRRAGKSSAADRARQKAAHAGELAGFARGKRAVTIAQARGELTVIRFFRDPQEAIDAPRSDLTGVCQGVVVADRVFAHDGHCGAQVSWRPWRDLLAEAA